ncbi:hypothetical protein L208DRAFT_565417 [Tricholoma matsutake]|nr:hypothetical protein L208DRAFT_565417 [Tricholoma matsutake 945]
MQRQRLVRRLASDGHTTSMRLAGRVWGIVRRRFAPHKPQTKENHYITIFPVSFPLLLVLWYLTPTSILILLSPSVGEVRAFPAPDIIRNVFDPLLISYPPSVIACGARFSSFF